MIYILIWILSIIFSIIIMDSKNRSKIIGLFLGLFLSIFGLIICLLLSKNEKTEEISIKTEPKKQEYYKLTNNDGNYEPGNCKWSTRKEQSQNTRITKLSKEKVRRIKWLLDVDKHTQKQIAEMFNIDTSIISNIKHNKSWN